MKRKILKLLVLTSLISTTTLTANAAAPGGFTLSSKAPSISAIVPTKIDILKLENNIISCNVGSGITNESTGMISVCDTVVASSILSTDDESKHAHDTLTINGIDLKKEEEKQYITHKKDAYIQKNEYLDLVYSTNEKQEKNTKDIKYVIFTVEWSH